MTFRKRVFTPGCQDVLCVCVVESTCYSYQKMGGNLSIFQPAPPVDKKAKKSDGNLSMCQPAHPTADNTKSKESSGSGHAISKQNLSEKQRHDGLHKTLQQMCDEYKAKYMFLKSKIVDDLIKDQLDICGAIMLLIQHKNIGSVSRTATINHIRTYAEHLVGCLDKYILCQDPLEMDEGDFMASKAIVDICLNVICTYKYLLSDEEKIFDDPYCNGIMEDIGKNIVKMEEILDSKCNNGPMNEATVQCMYLHQFEEALDKIKSNMKTVADYKKVKSLKPVQVMTIIDDPRIQREFTTLVNEMAKLYMPKLKDKIVIVEYEVDVEDSCTILRFKCKSATSRFTEMTEDADGGYKPPVSLNPKQHGNQLLMIEDSKEKQPLLIKNGDDQDYNTQKSQSGVQRQPKTNEHRDITFYQHKLKQRMQELGLVHELEKKLKERASRSDTSKDNIEEMIREMRSRSRNEGKIPPDESIRRKLSFDEELANEYERRMRRRNNRSHMDQRMSCACCGGHLLLP